MTLVAGGSDLVRLNVGGEWYTTTKSTLLSQPHTLFHKMLQTKQNGVLLDNHSGGSSNSGYYFIDRDGKLFRHVLNYLRSGKLHCPQGFKEYEQLEEEARFYRLSGLESEILKMKEGGEECYYMEVIEISHPEKVGLCCSRVVLSDTLREIAPFCDILDEQTSDYEVYEGQRGRFWIRTSKTRLEWAEILRSHGWSFCTSVAFIRKIPDITGRGTDMTHVVEKWSKSV